MKLTKTKLKQIIKEELGNVLDEKIVSFTCVAPDGTQIWTAGGGKQHKQLEKKGWKCGPSARPEEEEEEESLLKEECVEGILNDAAKRLRECSGTNYAIERKGPGFRSLKVLDMSHPANKRTKP